MLLESKKTMATFVPLFYQIKQFMQRISLFQKVDRTHAPIKSVNIAEALSFIKTSNQKKLITFARTIGKDTKNIEYNSYFFDFDEYYNSLSNPKIVKQIIETTKDKKLFVFYAKSNKDFVEKKINNTLLKVEKTILIDDFVDFFKLQQNYCFLCPTWHNFDSVRQEKDGVKGELEVTLRSLYDYIKCVKIPVVTWNCEFEGKRTLKNAKNLSGFIYMEIDDFSNKNREEIHAVLTDNGLSFIKAVWKSFGGKGFGLLIEVDGLTLENFKPTWLNIQQKFYNDFKIKVDKATKDISRLNVLSFDENIFIRENTIPLQAVAKTEEGLKLKVQPMSSSIQTEILAQYLNVFYYDKKYLNEDENRMTYAFYQNFFSKTNHLGIALDEVLNFVANHNEEYSLFLNNNKYSYNSIAAIGERQYSTYASQFGTIQFHKNQYNISDDYVVYGIYSEYSGDVELKLEQLWKKSIEKEKNEQSILVKLALLSKRVGIPYKKVLDFVEQKYSYNPENVIKVKSIYTNSKYPFGLLMSLKESTKAKRRSAWIEKQQVNGFIVNETKSFNNTFEKETLLKKVYLEIGRRFGKIVDRNIILFLEQYFKETNAFGVPLQDALTFVKNKCDYYGIVRYADFWGKEIYENFSPYFDLTFIKNVNTEQDKKKVSDIIILPKNKKLSDLNLSVKDNKILWADTNMGKTTWACQHEVGKRIILVPTIGALKNIEMKYNAAAFYEAKKDITPENEIIVCTYSSFPNLFGILQSWKKTKEYTLFFDEQHNLAVSAEKGYRNMELNFLLDNMDCFGKRVFMTGTFFPVQHPSIKHLKTTRVKWQEQPQKNAQIIKYEDKIKSVEKLLVKGKKNIIYLQSKKMDKILGKLVHYLKSKDWTGIYLLNANEKNEPHFKNLITNEYLEADAQIIITTSVAIEAINILDLDVETVHFLTFENPRLMEQMVNRMRLQLPPKIYIYERKGIDLDGESGYFDVVGNQIALIKNAEEMLKYLASPKQKYKDTYDLVAAQKLFANHIFEKSSFFRVKDGEWEIDYLSIAFKVFRDETNFSRKNPKYLKSVLAEYGWNFGETLIDGEKMVLSEKIEFNEIKKLKQNEKEEYALRVLEQVKKDGIKELQHQMNNKMQFDNCEHPDIEWSVRIKLIKSSKYMTFWESCKMIYDWIVEHKMAEKKYDKIMRQIAVQIAVQTKATKSNVDFNNKFTDSVIKLYFEQKKKTPEKLFTKSEIVDFFNRRKILNPMLRELDGEKYAFDVFRKYFEINSSIHKGEVKFSFGGLNVKNDLNVFTSRFYEWAELSYNTQLLFSSDDLCAIMNEFRKDLPLLGQHKINNETALKLITDYITLKKTTKRVDGIPKPHYKIIDLKPELIKKYKIQVNQKIKKEKTSDSQLNKQILEQFYERNKRFETVSAIQIPSSGRK